MNKQFVFYANWRFNYIYILNVSWSLKNLHGDNIWKFLRVIGIIINSSLLIKKKNWIYFYVNSLLLIYEFSWIYFYVNWMFNYIYSQCFLIMIKFKKSAFDYSKFVTIFYLMLLAYYMCRTLKDLIVPSLR